MTRHLILILAAGLAGPAMAQQSDSGTETSGAGSAAAEQQLDQQAVQQFFDPMAEEARQGVESGDWAGLQGWLAEHVTDEASFAMEGQMAISGGPASTFSTVMSGEELKRFAAMSGGGQGAMMQALDDYQIEVNVAGVQPLPGGKTNSQVMFTETGTMEFPGAEDPMTFVSATICDFMLSGGTAEEAEITFAGCRVTAAMS